MSLFLRWNFRPDRAPRAPDSRLSGRYLPRFAHEGKWSLPRRDSGFCAIPLLLHVYEKRVSRMKQSLHVDRLPRSSRNPRPIPFPLPEKESRCEMHSLGADARRRRAAIAHCQTLLLVWSLQLSGKSAAETGCLRPSRGSRSALRPGAGANRTSERSESQRSLPGSPRSRDTNCAGHPWRLPRLANIH